MFKLRVISFRKIKLNIKRFFIICFCILIILSVINGIKIILKSNKDSFSNINEVIYKRLLKDSFVFFDDNYNVDIDIGSDVDFDLDEHKENVDNNEKTNFIISKTKVLYPCAW